MLKTLFNRIISVSHALSFDVILGVLSSQLIVAQAFQLPFHLYHTIALACAVGLIYSVDHLLDLKKIKNEPVNPRRKFHYQNKGLLKTLGLLFLGGGLFSMISIEVEVLWTGLALFAFVAIYLIAVNQRKTTKQKELFVAVLYAMGIFLVPFALNIGYYWQQFDRVISWAFVYSIGLFVQYLLLALMNLYVFSFLEMEYDLKDAQNSLFVAHNFDSEEMKTVRESRFFQNLKMIKLVFLVTLISLVGQAVLLYLMGGDASALIHNRWLVFESCALIFLVHFVLFHLPIAKKLSMEHRRALGDISFILPLFLFI